jgi:plasmid maintenance system antidote protein VapI
MKNSRDLSEVAVRLEQAYSNSKDAAMTPQEQYDLYESIAIQILDSEFDEYEERVLEDYLVTFLEGKRIQLLREEI